LNAAEISTIDLPLRLQARTLVLCLLVAMVEGFDLQTAGVTAPKVAPEFAMDPTQVGWFFSSSTLGLLIGAVAGGRLSDRYGRKSMLIVALMLFGCGSLFTGAASDFPLLLFARWLTGLGLGGALPNAVALTAEIGSHARRAVRVAMMAAAMPIGGTVCALVAAWADSLSWRVIFQIGGVLPLILVAMLVFLLPESAAFRAARSATGENRPSLYWTLFGARRARTTVLLWSAFLTTLAVSYLMINWLPSLLVGKGYTRPQAALGALIYGLGGSVGGMSFGGLLGIGRTNLITAAAYLGIGGSALLLAWCSGDFVPALIAAGLLGFFVNGGQFILYGVSSTFYPTLVRGTGVGSALSMGRVGAFAGPLLAGALLSAGGNPTSVLVAILPLTAIAGLSAVLLMRLAINGSP
jgi:AAHS family 3-hydroxyphenylpropionic acid transporter